MVTLQGEMCSRSSGSLTFTSVIRTQHSAKISEPRCTPTTPRMERRHSLAHSRISILSKSSSSSSSSSLFHVKSKVKRALKSSWDKTIAKRSNGIYATTVDANGSMVQCSTFDSWQSKMNLRAATDALLNLSLQF